MMKNFAAGMQKGDLQPKERALLLIHNAVAKDTTGKEILTKADKYALVEGWTPRTNNEAKEYNRYNNGWILEGSMRIDAQTAYLNAEISLLQASKIVDYALWADYERKDEGYLKYCNKDFLSLNEDDVLDLLLKNSGLAFDQVIHTYTFQNLSDELRRDILTLDPDAETESQYLDQEEALADLFNGKKHLTAEAKEKLADLILAIMHNPLSEIFKEKGLQGHEWWLSGFFAELPTIAIAKKCAEYHQIRYEVTGGDLEAAEKAQKDATNASQLITGNKSLDKELRKDELGIELLIKRMKEYAEANDTDVRELLKQTILRWLNEGLFVSEYGPIWNSNGKNTCNNADTKLPHKEVLQGWLKAKAEAKAALQKLIDSGQLKVEIRDKNFFGVKETAQIITGKSLYALEGDFIFAADFKKQVEDLKPLGCLILFLRNRDFLEGYASLLAFAEMYKKLSKIYEIDLGYKIATLINNFRESVENLNKKLGSISDKLKDAIHSREDIKFSIELFMNDMLIRLEEIPPGTDEIETYYTEEFKKIFGDEF